MNKRKIILLSYLLFFYTSVITAQLTVDNDSVIDTNFSNPIELGEVVIVAKTRNIDSRGLGNMRINIKQLSVSPLFLGEKDVIKTLQFLPGVSAGMEGSSQLNIRGGTNDQTLYLMDGVPVYNQNHTFGLFSIFNSDAIISADLYKGGIPAQYGDKLSGVISTDLKAGGYKKHNHSVSLGLLAGTIASEGPILKDKLSYLFVGRRSFLDLFYNLFTTFSGEYDGGNAMISFYDINGKINWKIKEKNNLSWQIYVGNDDLYGRNKSKARETKEKFLEKNGYGWNTFMTSLRLQSQIKKNLSLSSVFYFSHLNNFEYYKNKIELPDLTVRKENGKSSILKELGGKANMTHKTSISNAVTYGIESTIQIFTPNSIYQIDGSRINRYHVNNLKLFKASVHLHDELRYKQWLLNLGIRASYYDNQINGIFVFEPRIKINTFITDNNKLMFAYDRMFQPVHTINEMNYNVQTDFWVPYKEDVLPNSNQISLGWKNYAANNLTFSVEAYYKKMNNLLLITDVEYYMDAHTACKQGGGRSKGLEFMTEYSNNEFAGWISYTLSKSERSFDRRTYPFKYDTPHDLSVFASYITRFNKKEKHTASLNVQYKSGTPYYVAKISFPGMGLPTLPSGYGDVDNFYSIDYVPQYPNTRLKNFFRIDANYSIERKLRHGMLIWQFSLLNVTNRKNPYAVYKKNDQYKAFVLIPLLPSISVKRTF